MAALAGVAMFALMATAVPPCSAQKPAEAESVRAALLAFVKDREPEASTGSIRAQLDVFEIELEEALAGAKDGREKVRRMIRYFFRDQRFTSSPDLASADHFYLDKVLQTREGYCLSLSALILAVTERLKLPLKGVASPRHFFLRWDDGRHRYNIETTEGGRFHDDSYYRAQGVTEAAERAGSYLKPLSTRQVIAYLYNNQGYMHLVAGRSREAEGRFREALRLHAPLLEARINLGIALAERGETRRADAMFSAVQNYLPDDGALRLNRAVVALRAGRYAESLEAVRLAGGAANRNPLIRQAQDAVIATVLRPEVWRRYQTRLVARGEELRRRKALARGLRGEYFANDSLSGKPVLSRVDPQVRFEWRYGSPGRGVPSDRFSVSWEGYVDLPAAGTWEFHTVVNDGVRLWVDELPIIENWKPNEGALDSKSLMLHRGLHPIRIEYFDRRAFAGITLEVKRADRARPLRGALFHER